MDRNLKRATVKGNGPPSTKETQMAYGDWAGRSTPKGSELDGKAFSRADLQAWDTKWHLLSTDARKAYLNDIKGPSRGQGPSPISPSVSVDKLKPKVFEELSAAGFVFVEPSRARNKPDRVIAVEGAIEFAKRVRGLQRQHLLDPNAPGDLASYVGWMFHDWLLWPVVQSIAKRFGIDSPYMGQREALSLIANFRWQGWVEKTLNDPVAHRVLEVVRKAEGPIPLVKLVAGLEPQGKPTAVREALDRLLSHLALVEDLDPVSRDIVVGFVPAVRAGIAKASAPRVRPPLEVCEAPREFGPEGGLFIDDLRALLLEVVAESPRLRQDGGLFVKEHDRFLAALQSVPTWFSELTTMSHVHRLEGALDRGVAMRLLQHEDVDHERRLRISSKGEEWLAAGYAKQYADVYEAYRAKMRADGFYSESPLGDVMTIPEFRSEYYSYMRNDERFLGGNVTVVRTKQGQRPGRHMEPKDEDIDALRNAVGKALTQLPAGVFHVLNSVVGHFSHGADNVAMVGKKPEEVTLCVAGSSVRPFEEEQETVGRLLLQGIILTRLIPLGGFQAAIDDQGRVCVARTDRLGPYFGIGRIAEEAPEAAVGTRVVVQPDFSVVVIGLATAPLADLAPFCERVTRGGTPGAVQFKITRQSVVRAVGHGLSGDVILQRLRTYASKDLPANVEREIKEWSGRVRKVKPETLKVIRCPDRETADRIATVLRKSVERLNESLLGLNAALTQAERKKLQEQGILIEGGVKSGGKKAKAKRAKPSWSRW